MAQDSVLVHSLVLVVQVRVYYGRNCDRCGQQHDKHQSQCKSDHFCLVFCLTLHQHKSLLSVCLVSQATRHAELEAINQLLAASDNNVDWSR